MKAIVYEQLRNEPRTNKRHEYSTNNVMHQQIHNSTYLLYKYIRQTNVALAKRPTPSPSLIQPSGQTAAQRPLNDRELWINLPPSYDRNRKKYKTFQNAIVLYLGINRHIYHNNEKEIGFVLSYLNDKEATQWVKLGVAWIE
jgi:hypothetical protein